jgi:hypothetical protein
MNRYAQNQNYRKARDSSSVYRHTLRSLQKEALSAYCPDLQKLRNWNQVNCVFSAGFSCRGGPRGHACSSTTWGWGEFSARITFPASRYKQHPLSTSRHIPFNVTWILAPLKNQSLLNEHANYLVVFLVQTSDDVRNRDPHIDKKIADHRPSLPDRIKRSQIWRIDKDLVPNLESVSFECHKPPRFSKGPLAIVHWSRLGWLPAGTKVVYFVAVSQESSTVHGPIANLSRLDKGKHRKRLIRRSRIVKTSRKARSSCSCERGETEVGSGTLQ